MIDRDQAQLVIERGQRASALLEDETFLWVVEDQTAYHVAALVAARPHLDRDAVDYHHSLQHALSELIATLKGHAEAGAAMERALAEMAEEDDTEI